MTETENRKDEEIMLASLQKFFGKIWKNKTLEEEVLDWLDERIMLF